MKLPARSYLLVENNLCESYNELFESADRCIDCLNFKLFLGSKLNCEKRICGGKHRLFVGDFYDHDNPAWNNAQIADWLSAEKRFTEIATSTYRLSGKWLIIEDAEDGLRIFGDPTCTKCIAYHATMPVISDLASVVASITNELSVYKLKDTEPDYYSFAVGSYSRTDWWCGKVTAFLNVYALLPNRIYHYDNKVNTSVYIPTHKLPYDCDKQNVEYCYRRSMDLLKGFMKAVSLRGKNIQLSLTGGLDSRMLWAASRVAGVNLSIFISMHGNKTMKHKDIVIADKLARYFNTQLNILPKRSLNNDTVTQIKQYFGDMNSAEYFADMEFSRHYPKGIRENLLFISGLIPEVISRYYDNRLLHVTAKGLCDVARCANDKFAKKLYGEWLTEIKSSVLPEGYSIMDLFYWEHRAGRWASQTSNVSDLYMEILFGINCREFFDMWIQIKDLKLRRYPVRQNIREITRRFDSRYSDIEYASAGSIFGRMVYFIESMGVFGLPFRQIEYILRRIKRQVIKLR